MGGFEAEGFVSGGGSGEDDTCSSELRTRGGRSTAGYEARGGEDFEAVFAVEGLVGEDRSSDGLDGVLCATLTHLFFYQPLMIWSGWWDMIK